MEDGSSSAPEEGRNRQNIKKQMHSDAMSLQNSNNPGMILILLLLLVQIILLRVYE